MRNILTKNTFFQRWHLRHYVCTKFWYPWKSTCCLGPAPIYTWLMHPTSREKWILFCNVSHWKVWRTIGQLSSTVDELLNTINAFNDGPCVNPIDPKDEGTIVMNDDNREAVQEEGAYHDELLAKQKGRKMTFNLRQASREMYPNMMVNV